VPRVLGIDPGLDGGIAIIDQHGTAQAWAMPTLEIVVGKSKKRTIDTKSLRNLLYSCVPLDLVVLERVWASKGEGVSSAFSFGVGYGIVQGLLAAMDVKQEHPTPQSWQRVVLRGSTTKTKASSVLYAHRRYNLDLLKTPKCRVPHDGMADAVCLAEFGRRLLLGDIDDDKRKAVSA
jgi:crossover junction endodeoxyribonuclease RuvC